MCGISACFNIKNAPEIAVRTLLGQDDRGKDATGVAYIKDGEIKVVKKATEPVKFYNSDDCPKDDSSIIAIAHNRAASSNTINKDKDEESHPFLSEDGSVAICHNGSVPDDDTLRDVLQKIIGHKFTSGIDSEVYLHLLEEAMKNSTTRNEAIKRVFEYARGNLLILFNDGTLYGIPNTAFFIVALCGNEGYIASEIGALRNIIPKDKEVTIFKRDYKNDDQLVRFYLEGNSTKLELFGTWSEVNTVGNWIPNAEIRCDFCYKTKWCEKIEINGTSYDRCLECFKEGKEEPYYKTTQHRRAQTRVGNDDANNTVVTCRGCNHQVYMNNSYYCPLCDKFYCKDCFFDKEKHKCHTEYSVYNDINLCFPNGRMYA